MEDDATTGRAAIPGEVITSRNVKMQNLGRRVRGQSDVEELQETRKPLLQPKRRQSENTPVYHPTTGRTERGGK